MWLNNLSEDEIKTKEHYGRVLCCDEVNVFSYWGEIIVCGIIIPDNIVCEVKDSKQLTEEQIKKIANILKPNVEYYIEKVSISECNKHYLQGEYKAIKRIVKRANPKAIMIDYHTIPELTRGIWQIGYFKADELLWTCASASILAKDYINNYWNNFISKYPEYNNTGKGTLTRYCLNSVFKYGYLPKYHRLRWIKSACKTMGLKKYFKKRKGIKWID